jgi:hypothetical protein
LYPTGPEQAYQRNEIATYPSSIALIAIAVPRIVSFVRAWYRLSHTRATHQTTDSRAELEATDSAWVRPYRSSGYPLRSLRIVNGSGRQYLLPTWVRQCYVLLYRSASAQIRNHSMSNHGVQSSVPGGSRRDLRPVKYRCFA